MGSLAYGTGRQALLDATISIVATGGLRSLTYRAVAAEAGVTQGLVRHHFGDWETLVHEAAVYSVRKSLDTAGFETDEPGYRRLSPEMIDLIAGDRDLQAFQFELALEARRRPELLPVLTSVYEVYREAMRRELARNGIDDPDLAWAAFAALDGIVFQLTVFGDHEAASRALGSLRALLISRSEAGAR